MATSAPEIASWAALWCIKTVASPNKINAHSEADTHTIATPFLVTFFVYLSV